MAIARVAIKRLSQNREKCQARRFGGASRDDRRGCSHSETGAGLCPGATGPVFRRMIRIYDAS
ncbi:hypothetical protein SBC1_14630 [Caballeronia sp. SBC1]|nr:hypothetical protein SBC2_16030 [Caballeronia sp. SBC2]QIN61471.1 hypothetical protein SBC1_14630 [Caballeronia sp. SBC1]